ncbi:MAG TPA: metalloregulator ArsR/SmtB family transcription factor [Sphingomonas sp.]|jgi:ArsR family transcriptional regulator|uniref:ArsR/SmtB family transcription factor n=1 Tax=Sphingomonas sp. TaxID=28214 RepID=UPI002ED8DD4D
MAPLIDIFRALADPTRLRIMALLRAMELSVGELAQVLGQSQPRVSRHVKILTDVGLADRRKEGAWVFVGLGDRVRVEPLLAAADGWRRPEDHEARADRDRLTAVRADRAAAAEAWFADHAAEWDAIRSLHVAESEVEAATVAMLSAGMVGRLVDIGTGTGRMIELLAPLANQALGVDRSPEMLRMARSKLSDAGLASVELRQGDMYALPLPPGSADTAVLHQVLHYAQQPAAAIAEAARLLVRGGRLLIVDFARHEREELRQRAAHVRLGFDDAQVQAWFGDAGLILDEVQELAGGALTVKLWLGRKGAGPLSKRIAA